MLSLIKNIINIDSTENKLKVLNSLIKSDRFDFKGEDFISETQYEFFNLLFNNFYLMADDRKTSFQNLYEIILSVETIKNENFNLTKFVDANIKVLTNLIRNFEDDELLELLNLINIKELKKSNQDILRNDLINQKIKLKSLNHFVKELNFNFNEFSCYQLSNNKEISKITKIKSYKLLNIVDFNDLEKKYESFNSYINFDDIIEERFVKGLFDNNINQEELEKLFNDKTILIKENYNSLLLQLIRYYNQKINKYSKTRLSNADKGFIRSLKGEVSSILNFYEKKKFKIYEKNNIPLNECFNNLLIELAKNNGNEIKKIIRNKEALSFIDINYTNSEKESLISILLLEDHIDVVERIKKLKKISYNDIQIGNSHLFSQVTNLVLNPYLNKSRKNKYEEFLNDVYKETDFNKEINNRNIAIQYLEKLESRNATVDYINNELKISSIQTYYTHNTLDTMCKIFKEKKISLNKSNIEGLKAEHYLFDKSLDNSSDDLMSFFKKKNEMYEIQGYENYDEKEKEEFLKNLTLRMITKKLDSYELNKYLIAINNLIKDEKHLINIVVDIMVEKNYNITNDSYTSIKDLKVLIEKEKLLKELKTTEKKEIKKVNKL